MQYFTVFVLCFLLSGISNFHAMARPIPKKQSRRKNHKTTENGVDRHGYHDAGKSKKMGSKSPSHGSKSTTDDVANISKEKLIQMIKASKFSPKDLRGFKDSLGPINHAELVKTLSSKLNKKDLKVLKDILAGKGTGANYKKLIINIISKMSDKDFKDFKKTLADERIDHMDIEELIEKAVLSMLDDTDTKETDDFKDSDEIDDVKLSKRTKSKKGAPAGRGKGRKGKDDGEKIIEKIMSSRPGDGDANTYEDEEGEEDEEDNETEKSDERKGEGKLNGVNNKNRKKHIGGKHGKKNDQSEENSQENDNDDSEDADVSEPDDGNESEYDEHEMDEEEESEGNENGTDEGEEDNNGEEDEGRDESKSQKKNSKKSEKESDDQDDEENAEGSEEEEGENGEEDEGEAGEEEEEGQGDEGQEEEGDEKEEEGDEEGNDGDEDGDEEGGEEGGEEGDEGGDEEGEEEGEEGEEDDGNEGSDDESNEEDDESEQDEEGEESEEEEEERKRREIADDMEEQSRKHQELKQTKENLERHMKADGDEDNILEITSVGTLILRPKTRSEVQNPSHNKEEDIDGETKRRASYFQQIDELKNKIEGQLLADGDTSVVDVNENGFLEIGQPHLEVEDEESVDDHVTDEAEFDEQETGAPAGTNGDLHDTKEDSENSMKDKKHQDRISEINDKMSVQSKPRTKRQIQKEGKPRFSQGVMKTKENLERHMDADGDKNNILEITSRGTLILRPKTRSEVQNPSQNKEEEIDSETRRRTSYFQHIDELKDKIEGQLLADGDTSVVDVNKKGFLEIEPWQLEVEDKESVDDHVTDEAEFNEQEAGAPVGTSGDLHDTKEDSENSMKNKKHQGHIPEINDKMSVQLKPRIKRQVQKEGQPRFSQGVMKMKENLERHMDADGDKDNILEITSRGTLIVRPKTRSEVQNPSQNKEEEIDSETRRRTSYFQHIDELKDKIEGQLLADGDTSVVDVNKKGFLEIEPRQLEVEDKESIDDHVTDEAEFNEQEAGAPAGTSGDLHDTKEDSENSMKNKKQQDHIPEINDKMSVQPKSRTKRQVQKEGKPSFPQGVMKTKENLERHMDADGDKDNNLEITSRGTLILRPKTRSEVQNPSQNREEEIDSETRRRTSYFQHIDELKDKIEGQLLADGDTSVVDVNIKGFLEIKPRQLEVEDKESIDDHVTDEAEFNEQEAGAPVGTSGDLHGTKEDSENSMKNKKHQDHIPEINDKKSVQSKSRTKRQVQKEGQPSFSQGVMKTKENLERHMDADGDKDNILEITSRGTLILRPKTRSEVQNPSQNKEEEVDSETRRRTSYFQHIDELKDRIEGQLLADGDTSVVDINKNGFLEIEPQRLEVEDEETGAPAGTSGDLHDTNDNSENSMKDDKHEDHIPDINEKISLQSRPRTKRQIQKEEQPRYYQGLMQTKKNLERHMKADGDKDNILEITDRGTLQLRPRYRSEIKNPSENKWDKIDRETKIRTSYYQNLQELKDKIEGELLADSDTSVVEVNSKGFLEIRPQHSEVGKEKAAGSHLTDEADYNEHETGKPAETSATDLQSTKRQGNLVKDSVSNPQATSAQPGNKQDHGSEDKAGKEEEKDTGESKVDIKHGKESDTRPQSTNAKGVKFPKNLVGLGKVSGARHQHTSTTDIQQSPSKEANLVGGPGKQGSEHKAAKKEEKEAGESRVDMKHGKESELRPHPTNVKGVKFTKKLDDPSKVSGVRRQSTSTTGIQQSASEEASVVQEQGKHRSENKAVTKEEEAGESKVDMRHVSEPSIKPQEKNKPFEKPNDKEEEDATKRLENPKNSRKARAVVSGRQNKEVTPTKIVLKIVTESEKEQIKVIP